MVGEYLREYSELLEKKREEFNKLKGTVGVKIDKIKLEAHISEKNRDTVGLKVTRIKLRLTWPRPESKN